MTLDYLILTTLAELPTNKAARSKYLTEKVNAKVMTTVFSQKAIIARLRVLKGKGFVKRALSDSWWIQEGYIAGYWSITDLGRHQLIKNSLDREVVQ